MVTARIDLNGLQQELNGFNKKLEQWSEETIKATESRRDEHIKRLKELQADIHELEQQQKLLEQRAEDVKQRLATEDAEIQSLEAELASIRDEQIALPARIQQLQTAVDTETAEAQKRAAKVENDQLRKQKKLDALNEWLNCYKDRLGLAFEHQDAEGESLHVILTNIDAKQPEKKFTFAVQVLEGDVYNVRSCEPPVAALSELVEELNASNDFSQFVRKLRREFQQMTTTA